ncbi:hypothetical protein GGR50DRAFT_693448 [Xylaria sp. CBS 124048]|nr:hypothetical protein GGR50DRAFT_693448 [Xylaria sp. CBS 124048]
MAFIRLYKESDFDDCGDICIATLPPTLAASPEAAKISPYIWTHPYTFLSPSTCHVLDDGTGKVVGYCIGCPNVQTFVSNYPSFEKAILSPAIPRPDLTHREPWIFKVPNPGQSNASTNTDGANANTTTPELKINPKALAQYAYRADWALLENKESLTSRWRATMHIDLLPDWQGKGWGRRLIDSFVGSVRESGQDYGEGEHIGVSGENTKVVPFYERMGFRVIEGGEREGNIWMVRDI